MSLNWTTFWQVVAWLATLGTAGSAYSGLIPMKYAGAVALVSALASTLLHWHAGTVNPDGSPASVAYQPKQ